MSIYHCNISNVSRAAGSSSCATLSYISGVAIHEDRTNQNYSYGRAERVVLTGTIIPPGAPAEFRNPETLFNAIEDYEKAANARPAKKIEIALPREFDLQTSRDVVEDYIKRNLSALGYAATYAIHHDADGRNPHAHILVANRQINPKTGEWGGKRKMIYALDADGNRVPLIDKKTGQQKVDSHGRKAWKRINAEVNPLDEKSMLKTLRQSWAEVCNERLQPADHIDARSYADQGKDQIPTVHEGYAARALVAAGGISDRVELNKQIKAANAELMRIAAARQTCHANLIVLEREQADAQREESAARLEQVKRLFDPDYDKHQKEAAERQRQEEAARAAARAAAEKAEVEKRRQAAAEQERQREDAAYEQYWINRLGDMDAEQLDYFCNNRFNNEYSRRVNAAESEAADIWIKQHVDQVTGYFKNCVENEKQKIAPWLKEHPKPYEPEPQQGNKFSRLFVDHWYKTSDGEVYYDKQYDMYRDHQQNLVDQWSCDYRHVGEPLERAKNELEEIQKYAKEHDYHAIQSHVYVNAEMGRREHTSLYGMIRAGARELIQTLKQFAPVRAMLKVVDMLRDQHSEELQRVREQQRERAREQQRQRSRGYGR